MDDVEFPDNNRFRKLLLSYPAKAIQFLYEYYYTGLIRIAERLTHDRMLAEDVVQEALVNTWLNHEWLGQQRGKSIQHYLIRGVRNRAITAYKKRKRNGERDYALFLLKENSKTESPEDHLILLEIQQHVRKIFSEFPRREKECFMLSREEEMSNKQIAESLKISEKAVERSITSARKRIRNLVKSFINYPL